MERRSLIKAFVALGACPICVRMARADDDVDWDYDGDHGPEHWGELDPSDAVCSAGSQQSPVDIRSPIKADVPPIEVEWNAGDCLMGNTGHTIQVNLGEGNVLRRGDVTYDLLQLHFHSPSEHHVEGKSYPMEAHFVHKSRKTGALGVLAVFLTKGAHNPAFAKLAASFPQKKGESIEIDDFNASGLLPETLSYWTYEGSLTTPPCTEIVDWMLAMDPVEVSAEDIARFTKLYPRNARPILSSNRRFILGSS